jgi:hypothetical protein
MNPLLLFLMAFSSQPEGDVKVAGYCSDYRSSAPPVAGWSYLWNAPSDLSSGAMGDPSGYVHLEPSGGDWGGVSAGPLRLTATGGHPGNEKGRYAIAAYTVSSSGFYSLENTGLITKSADGDGVSLFIHINDHSPVYFEDIDAGDDHCFDTPVGYLVRGDTLYVGIGPRGDSGSDEFEWDFSLVKKSAQEAARYVNHSSGTGGVAYTVPADGFYGIADSSFSGALSAEVRVHVSVQSPILRKTGAVLSAGFDTEVGRLKAGDVMYVTAEPGGGESFVNFRILYLPMDDIWTQVDKAYRSNQPSVRIFPGRYYASDYQDGEITMVRRSNFDINAYGVEMIIRSTFTRAVNINQSTNITIRGLQVDYDPLILTQGTILSIADNSIYMDIQLHNGYPVPNQNSTRGIIHDPATMRRKLFTRDYTITNVTSQGGGIYRLHATQSYPTNCYWEAGDYISFMNYAERTKTFLINESSGASFINTAIYCGAGWVVSEHRSSACVYDGVTIKPGKRPLMASIDRLRSTQSDGIHSLLAGVGPVIRNCHLEALGDDAIAISSEFMVVLEDSSETSLLIGAQSLFCKTGDRIRLYRMSDAQMEERTIVNLEVLTNYPSMNIVPVVTNYYPSCVHADQYDTAIRLTLDSAVTSGKGNLVSNRDRAGAGYTVSNNFISNGRARGIIIKASDGVIEGNRISHTALPGILLLAESHSYLEADAVSNVTVRNNVLRDTNEGWPIRPPLRHTGSLVVVFEDRPFLANRNLLIEGNRFYNSRGLQIQVNNAYHVELNRNEFFGPHQAEAIFTPNAADHTALIWCDKVDGVVLGTGTNANVYYNMGVYGNPSNTIGITANSFNVSGTVVPGDGF